MDHHLERDLRSIPMVDVLQRAGEHRASCAVELTPRVWKTLFADDRMRSDLDRARDPPNRLAR